MPGLLDGVLPPAAADSDEQVTPAPAAPAAPEPVVPDGDDDDEVVVPDGAENPDAVRAAMKSERKKAREANARARELQARLDAQTEETKPLEQRVTEAAQRAEEAELRALRIEVAAETGLDLKLAPRLVGKTREELIADATELQASVGTPGSQPAAPPEGGFRPAGTAGSPDPAKAHDNLLLALLAQGRPQPASALFAGLEPAPQD